MKWVDNNWFKLGVLLLAGWAIFSINSYLELKNRIEAYTNRANCYHSAMNSGINDIGMTNVCIDINYQVNQN